jgi:hypothetical protein
MQLVVHHGRQKGAALRFVSARVQRLKSDWSSQRTRSSAVMLLAP